MKTNWATTGLKLLAWGLLGAALAAGFSAGVDYGSEHWWHGNNLLIGLLLAAPAILAHNILGIQKAGISDAFCNVVYAFIGFFMFLGIGFTRIPQRVESRAKLLGSLVI